MTLVQDILREKDRLVNVVGQIPPSAWLLKEIDGTGGKVSVSDLIAYQIGWGKCLIRWYESGLRGELPELPGDGFVTWNYVSIAKHFYQKYRHDSPDHQLGEFQQVVSRIIEITEGEQLLGNLDRIGVWPWCTLPSGKHWPLSKWIRVNTASPYKRASSMVLKWWRARE